MLPYFTFAMCSVLALAMIHHFVGDRGKGINAKVKEKIQNLKLKKINKEVKETKEIKIKVNGIVLVTVLVSLLLGFNIIELETYGKTIVALETILTIVFGSILLIVAIVEKS